MFEDVSLIHDCRKTLSHSRVLTLEIQQAVHEDSSLHTEGLFVSVNLLKIHSLCSSIQPRGKWRVDEKTRDGVSEKKEEENPSQNDSEEMMSIQLEARGGEDEFEA